MDNNDLVRDQLRDHIEKVGWYLNFIQRELRQRANDHDMDKFEKDEFPRFAQFTPKLSECEYGSNQYKKYLKELQPALEKHYQVNRHHPEHFPSRGIQGMNLIDLLEMICDWFASTKRQKNGNIYQSIEINQKRFGYSNEIKEILRNTIMFLIQQEKLSESESLARYLGGDHTQP